MTDRTPPAGGPLTVADVLALPVMAAGVPQVVAGGAALDRHVRWVHITELTDPASFLKGGELVLTTGLPLPTQPSLVRRYVDEFADTGAAGLVIELVRRFHRPPDSLVQACRRRGLRLRRPTAEPRGRHQTASRPSRTVGRDHQVSLLLTVDTSTVRFPVDEAHRRTSWDSTAARSS